MLYRLKRKTTFAPLTNCCTLMDDDPANIMSINLV